LQLYAFFPCVALSVNINEARVSHLSSSEKWSRWNYCWISSSHSKTRRRICTFQIWIIKI